MNSKVYKNPVLKNSNINEIDENTMIVILLIKRIYIFYVI